MLNKMILQGRLTAAPELKQTQSGVSVLTFTVAWSEKYKEIETKCFQRCTAWRGTAEFIAKYFTKGQEIVVSGKMTTREWEDNGQKRSMNELLVDEAHFCGKKDQTQGNSPAPAQSPAAASTTPYSAPSTPQFETLSGDDDLPF